METKDKEQLTDKMLQVPPNFESKNQILDRLTSEWNEMVANDINKSRKSYSNYSKKMWERAERKYK